MSQGQPRRPIKYGDVSGELGNQPITPQEAAVMQSSAVRKSSEDDLVTIGEALETAALSASEKPVEQSDAAAIQAAEVRATGRMQLIPGGVAAKAQGAASLNARAMRDEDKTKLGDVLVDASTLLPKDKVVTREDAEGVIGAGIRNQPEPATYLGGVAASIAAAARLNQNIID
ncbi:late embryogenesis abundant protein D-34-like [Bidens hawaiensis]|uniref:late embryogenesis abundant protein D-34-like n=1 Tax=Bidens hawaiensis TaxID=980011 RepID=UPI0040493B5C